MGPWQDGGRLKGVGGRATVGAAQIKGGLRLCGGGHQKQLLGPKAHLWVNHVSSSTLGNLTVEKLATRDSSPPLDHRQGHN